MRFAAVTALFGALLASTLNVDAFSPAARSRVLNNLKEISMSGGAGGAAQPEYDEGGEISSVHQCRHLP
eukprot:scaffold14050_cov255-Alexandrium_tamarense.AAC.1